MYVRGGAIVMGCLLAGTVCRAADSGVITGIIDKPAAVTALFAINREDDKKFPGRIDANTGRFTIQGLPSDKIFDVIVDAGPVRLEGINLTVPRSDFEEEQPLTAADRKKLDKEVRRLDKFCDTIEVMAITGNVQHAAVIMTKLRTQPFYMSKPGEVVWRLELWRFNKPDETWIKDQEDFIQTYYRQRIQRAEFNKKILTLDPALGGIRFGDKEAKADVGKVIVPGNEAGVRLRKENIKEVASESKGN